MKFTALKNFVLYSTLFGSMKSYTKAILSFINSHCLITQLTILRGNVHARTYLLVLLPVNSIYYFSITVTYPVICIIAITITARKEFNYYYYCNILAV